MSGDISATYTADSFLLGAATHPTRSGRGREHDHGVRRGRLLATGGRGRFGRGLRADADLLVPEAPHPAAVEVADPQPPRLDPQDRDAAGLAVVQDPELVPGPDLDRPPV